jgi:ribosomal protein S12 methylthiotransferase
VGTELFDQADGIDAIVGLGRRDSIAGIIEETLRCTENAAYLKPSQRAITNPVADDRARLLITPSHWAYLRISEGCNHSCSFCAIPAIRGRFRSKPEDNILAEAVELVSAGAVELNIIAQDTTSYGQDLKIKDGLSTLVGKLEKIADLRWLRLMYLYPAAVTDKLIETVAKSEKIVPYVDIPVQHINNKILKNMRRGHTGESIYRLIERLRLALPDIVLRTTVIVGFPGETDRQFNELLEFVRWARFDALGCFKFYAESGTPAAEMPDQVSEHIKDKRREQLMLAQQEIAFAKNKSRIGTKLTCLLDSFESDGTARGRFYGQAPDIDSVCIVENCSTGPGSFINTRVVAAKDYDLVVRQI